MNGNTINTLHKAQFYLKKYGKIGAATQMPTGNNPVGALYLPTTELVSEKELSALKAHEYGHVALFSREIIPQSFIEEFQKEGASDVMVDVCLDAAVNALIATRCRDLPLEILKLSFPKFEEGFKAMPLEDKVTSYLQLVGLEWGGYKTSRMELDAENKKRKAKIRKVREAMDAIITAAPGASRLCFLADQIAYYCINNLSFGTRSFEYDEYYKNCRALLRRMKQAASIEEAGEEFKKNASDQLDFPVTSGQMWGRMRTEECDMEHSMMRNWKQKHMPRYVGSLRYMHRAMTDMKVWGLKDRSIPPLAVLIDCSGSMKLETEALIKILEKQPASVVAGYSGSGSEGALYLLGKDGKYAGQDAVAAMREEVGYGNIVDGPALMWLSQQKGRRIWICDGVVTGAQEVRSEEMGQFCKNMIQKYNIEYYTSVEDFFASKVSKFHVYF